MMDAHSAAALHRNAAGQGSAPWGGDASGAAACVATLTPAWMVTTFAVDFAVRGSVCAASQSRSRAWEGASWNVHHAKAHFPCIGKSQPYEWHMVPEWMRSCQRALEVITTVHVRRSQPDKLQALFNRPDARLVVFRGREALVAPVQKSPAAGASGNIGGSPAATPGSQVGSPHKMSFVSLCGLKILHSFRAAAWRSSSGARLAGGSSPTAQGFLMFGTACRLGAAAAVATPCA